jgi:RNA polymerase sigma-70 factor (ECF subfamily)
MGALQSMPGDEASLVQRAKQGDPAAFAEIYDRLQPAIYRYVLYRVEDTAVAEDLASEVFVRVVTKIDRFNYRGRPLLAWLYTIARNLIADHHRSAGKRHSTSLEEGSAVSSFNLDDVVEQRLARARLFKATSRLTEDQRQVILLKFVEGYDNEAVAEVVGKSVGSVKSLQHRALAALRRILEQD